MPIPSEDNGRVTTALLGQKLDQVISRLDRLDDKLEGYVATTDFKCSEVKIDLEKVKSKQEARDEDIAELKKKSDTWSMLNSVAAAITFIIAAVATEIGLRK